MRAAGGLRAALVTALVLGPAPGVAEFPGARAYQTVEVGPGVYAFVSPETNGPIPSGNVVAVIVERAYQEATGAMAEE
jgi:hypothetical protein